MNNRFEGWYFRHQQGDTLLSLIAGRSQESAFVQVVTNRASYHVPYPIGAFAHDATPQGRSSRRDDIAPYKTITAAYSESSSKTSCDEPRKKSDVGFGTVHIGENRFAESSVTLDIRTADLRLTGELRYGPWVPLRYDIMGPFRFLPMECRHSVFSLLHRVEGQVSLNGALLRFDHGTGYAEGDRGRSFPSRYAWLQWGDLEARASVMLSIARIPLAGFRFWGCIAVVWVNGQEYRLATYLGAQIRRMDERHMEIVQGRWNLKAEVLGDGAGCPLQAPDNGKMNRVIHENVGVKARIWFGEMEKDGKALLAVEGVLAGVEVV